MGLKKYLLMELAHYQAKQQKKPGAGGYEMEVVKRSELKGFKVVPKRWVVERTFAWNETNRRNATVGFPFLVRFKSRIIYHYSCFRSTYWA
ncbi:MAG: hypothetical protein IPJ81_13695 [Chitinophagaceae bacterium]|nr:hypothetical protein [Chitinophagaceae bacterium]